MSLRCLLLAFLMSLAAASLGTIRGAEPPGAAAADTKRIDQLIHQLGDSAFEQRESATQALERLGVPALPALKKATKNEDAEVRRRAADLVERIENSLDQLLLDYRSYGLPLPPDKAPLVRVENCEIMVLHMNYSVMAIDHPGRCILGFLLEPLTKHQKARVKVMHATETFPFNAINVSSALDPHRLTINDLNVDQLEPSLALAFALQMHDRRWEAAETVFKQGFHGKSDDSPRTALRMLAWDYWDKQILDANANRWPAACKHMKVLLADERKLDTPRNCSLLKSLELALVPSKAKPESVEALIDDLISVRNPEDRDERYARVLDLGFEAVPALLAHLEDDRLTRYREMSVCLNIHDLGEPTYHWRVRDFASTLLRSLAGRVASEHWPANRDDRIAEKRHATAWWEEARKQGEEAYLVAHVLPAYRIGDPDKHEWLEMAHVRLLSKKYPRNLGPLYRNVLANRPRVVSHPLADAVGASSLPQNEKVELLCLGVASNNLEHRYGAFFPLREVDAERFVSLLVATLDNLPPTPSVPYSECREACFALLVCYTDDPRAWRALEKAARRVDVGLRMEMLMHTNYPEAKAIQRQRRLAFLTAFLDDETVREVSTENKMFSGIYAGSHMKRLEVRNFAALRIAKNVGEPADETLERTAEQWAKLREQMREVVKRELAEAAKE